MAERTLLDTDIFSEVMRGKNAEVVARADVYVTEHGRLTISLITVLEIAKGLQNMDRFVGSLGSLDVLAFGREEALLAGRIYGDLERVGQPIGRADPMIAAVALTRELPLTTANVAHYERIRALGYALTHDNWKGPRPRSSLTERSSPSARAWRYHGDRDRRRARSSQHASAASVERTEPPPREPRAPRGIASGRSAFLKTADPG